MTTIKKLEAALKDVNLTIQKNFDGCDGYGREHVEDFLLVHHAPVKEALTQAIAIKKGDMVVVPREPTERMLAAGKQANNALFVMGSCGVLPSSHFPHNAIYTAMIAAQEEK